MADPGAKERIAQELVRPPHDELGLPRPAYGGRSNANIVPSLVRALGGPREGLLPPLERGLDPFDGRAPPGPVVVVVVDGLGWNSLQGALAATDDPLLRRWSEPSDPITTVFPTTTVAALVSVSTGAAPAQHGAAGYRLYLPGFGVVADLLKMMPVGLASPESLVGPSWSPQVITDAPTIFRRLGTGVAISRESFRSTGFTRLLYDGAEYRGYATASELAHELARTLTSRPLPPIVYAYWDEFDTVQHLRGPAPRHARFELERLAHLLAHVAEDLGSAAQDVTVLLTGDHGQVEVRRELQLAVDEHPDLLAQMSRPIGGDRRGAYFAAAPGKEDGLARDLERYLPPGSRRVGIPDALAGGLFGPGPWHPEIEVRLGTFLALPVRGSGIVQHLPGATRPTRHLAGGHGGLEADELLVPLVHARLSELARR